MATCRSRFRSLGQRRPHHSRRARRRSTWRLGHVSVREGVSNAKCSNVDYRVLRVPRQRTCIISSEDGRARERGPGDRVDGTALLDRLGQAPPETGQFPRRLPSYATPGFADRSCLVLGTSRPLCSDGSGGNRQASRPNRDRPSTPGCTSGDWPSSTAKRSQPTPPSHRRCDVSIPVQPHTSDATVLTEFRVVPTLSNGLQAAQITVFLLT